MGGPSNPLDNVVNYIGMLTEPDRERHVDPPDGSMINGRATTDDAEAAVVAEGRQQEREAGAAMVAGIGRGR